MTTQAQETSVRTEIVVEVPIQHAFAVFTARTVTWKPTEHNLLEVEIEETVFEAHEGGYVYDRGVDGSECRWARVLAIDPPHRIVLSWLISPRWKIDTDESRASEVEVRFSSEAPDRTRVVIEHRNLERHGEGWEGMRDSVGAPGGWPLYLRRFSDGLKG
jgi:uncharacterized protein YndB with AHSA1/START domain